MKDFDPPKQTQGDLLTQPDSDYRTEAQAI